MDSWLTDDDEINKMMIQSINSKINIKSSKIDDLNNRLNDINKTIDEINENNEFHIKTYNKQHKECLHIKKKLNKEIQLLKDSIKIDTYKVKIKNIMNMKKKDDKIYILYFNYNNAVFDEYYIIHGSNIKYDLELYFRYLRKSNILCVEYHFYDCEYFKPKIINNKLNI